MNKTAIQKASSIAIGSYRAACRLLSPAEQAVLRSIVASAIARDSADAIRDLDDLDQKRAA